MSGYTKLWGISMAERSHRRALVICSYAAAIAVVAISTLMPRLNSLSVVNLEFVMIFVISQGLFGQLVKPSLWLLSRHVEPRVDPGLGLAASAPREEPRIDERDLAVRNSAFFIAYKWIVGAAFVTVNILVFCMGSHSPLARVIGIQTILFFMVLLFTLPQAVVLWTEPDMFIDESDM